MNLTDKLTGRAARESDRPVPAQGMRRYLFLLGTNFWKLIGLNLLFLLFSLPVVTLPAALCALNRAAVKLVRDGYCLVWLEFRDEFKCELFKALPIGALSLALFGAAYYLLSLSLSNPASIYGMLFGALGLTVLFGCTAVSAYAFLMLPMLSLRNRDVLSNAYRLALLGGWRTLSTLGVCFCAAALLAVLFPLSLALLAFFAFSFTQFTLCALLNPVIQRYVIAPYEERTKRAA